MANWVVRIETAMEDCPSAEKPGEEKPEEEKPEGELDSKVPDSNNGPQD